MKPRIVLTLWNSAVDLSDAPHWKSFINDKRVVCEQPEPSVDAVLHRFSVPLSVKRYELAEETCTPAEMAARLDRTYRLILHDEYGLPTGLVEQVRLVPTAVSASPIGVVKTPLADPDALSVQTSTVNGRAAELIELAATKLYTRGAPDVKVAVLDTGADVNHPELRGRFSDLADFVDLEGLRTHPVSRAAGFMRPTGFSLRSPSGGPGQIELKGVVDHISIFHGGTDDEFDWHIHLRLDPAVRRRLFTHLLEHGKWAKTVHWDGFKMSLLVEFDLEFIQTERMVLDGFDNSTFDELFYSAYVTEALRLVGDAWDHSADVGDEQNLSGASKTVSSGLYGHRVLVQGAFVNDADHLFRVELHSMDSVAYPLGSDREHVDAHPGTSGWPSGAMSWRVAVFTASSFHRIGGASSLKHPRRTRWLLPLPTGNRRAGWTITERLVGFRNGGLTHIGLDDRLQTAGVVLLLPWGAQPRSVDPSRPARRGRQALRRRHHGSPIGPMGRYVPCRIPCAPTRTQPAGRRARAGCHLEDQLSAISRGDSRRPRFCGGEP